MSKPESPTGFNALSISNIISDRHDGQALELGEFNKLMVLKFRIDPKAPKPKQRSRARVGETKVTSCLRCRRLKRKCDKTLPVCYSCERTNSECLYVPRKQRNVPAKLPVEQRPEQSISAPPPVTIPRDEPRKEEFRRDLPFTPNSDPNFYLENNALTPLILALEAVGGMSARPLDRPFEEEKIPLERHLPPPLMLRPDIFSRKGLLSNDDLSVVMPRPNAPASYNSRIPNFNSYPKQVSSVLISAVKINTNSNITLIPPIVDENLMGKFIEAYFRHNHRAYPIINRTEFSEKVRRIGVQNLHQYDDQFELNMIAAIGCTSLERAGHISKDKKILEYFASKALSLVLNNLTNNDSRSVRYLLLLGLYSYFDPSEFTSWEITGKLTRLLILLGLNKKLSPQAVSNMGQRDVEMRYRLFWGVYLMDRMISVSLGRPVGINDDDINIPLPEVLDSVEESDVKITRLIIGLRKLEGQILKQVHSVNAGEDISDEHRLAVLDTLKNQIEEWYANSGKLKLFVTSAELTALSISFHGLSPWYAARYHHLIMLLYRPSYLNPKPSLDILETLGKACLQNLSYTYHLYTSALLPLNWITLYRFLTVCSTILYCLCNWSIDLIDSKTEIGYCIEILEGFSNDWVVAKKCAEVFRTIDRQMLEISLTSKGVPDMDKLLTELLGASSSYHEILSEYQVEISLNLAIFY